MTNTKATLCANCYLLIAGVLESITEHHASVSNQCNPFFGRGQRGNYTEAQNRCEPSCSNAVPPTTISCRMNPPLCHLTGCGQAHIFMSHARCIHWSALWLPLLLAVIPLTCLTGSLSKRAKTINGGRLLVCEGRAL